MAKPVDIIINSLRGGQNDEDPPNLLADDECSVAENVEFFYSALGERRAGCEAVDVSESNIDDEDVVVHITQRFPDNDILNPEIWVIAASEDTSVTVTNRAAGLWSTIVPEDAIDPDVPYIYRIQSQALNGKLHFAYKAEGSINRFHVYDPDTDSLRPSGLAQPSPPTGANEGSGSFTGTRYYRVRFITKDGSDILLRSEPSTHLTFSPSGSGDGVRVTRPSLPGEAETHWELEASLDNATFYVIAELTAATTSFDDETSGGYSSTTIDNLSPEVGEYNLLPAAEYVVADGDRLILGGHFTDPDMQSRVMWTPTSNTPGAGNDERLPLSVDNYVNLDSYEGGGLTGLSQPANGVFYAFKWQQIYRMVRTGLLQRAYDVVTVSKSRGAIPGSIISGMDEYGRACIYFLDPIAGPSRLGVSGLQTIRGLRRTWQKINLQASKVIVCSAYYLDKQQVHWWVATDGSDSPNYRMVLQVTETRNTDGGVGKGWSVATGRSSEAMCAGVVNELVSEDGVVNLSKRPFIGLTSPDYLCRMDVGSTDNGEEYTATIRSKPYILAGLLNNWGILTAALLASANTESNIEIKLIRDFGIEENSIFTDLVSVTGEEFVIKRFDNLHMAESSIIQIEFTDAN